MKGIILAGGRASRLYPITKAINKHTIPIYDKPMIYYPLSTLMLAKIREILIISSEEHIDSFKKLFSDGKQLGLNIEYKIQDKPGGIPEAFKIGEDFIGNESVCLILGDNVFYGNRLSSILKECVNLQKGAIIFGYHVSNPSEFGVIDFDESFNVLSIEEKPKRPKSNFIIPGLYFYDNSVIKKSKLLKPSKRGELEITDINKMYLKEKNLKVKILGRGYAWLDTGTCKGLSDATNFVKSIQDRTGSPIACLEEIAYKNNFIDEKQLKQNIKILKNTLYGDFLKLNVD